MSTRSRWLVGGVVVVVLAAIVVYLQVTVFAVQPMGALPEGRTVVMSRLNTTKFIDSADAMCVADSRREGERNLVGN